MFNNKLRHLLYSLFFLGIFLFPLKTFATAPIYTWIFGNSNFSDSIFQDNVITKTTVDPTSSGNKTQILLATTTPYTVVGFSFYHGQGTPTYFWSLSCGGDTFSNETTAFLYAFNITTIYGQFHCNSDLVLTTSATPGALEVSASKLQYVKRDTRSQSYDSMNYKDQLFISILILFLLAFIPFGFLYSVLKPRKS